MAGSSTQVHVSERILSVQRKVADTAAEVEQIRQTLIDNYCNARGLMGQSDDLAVFEEKFYGGMDALLGLIQALSDFSKKLGEIRLNYHNVQEEAILRATMIPK